MHTLGNPNYNVFGWQKPCYLLNEGYTKTFKELMETTKWKIMAAKVVIQMRRLYGSLRL